MPGQEEGHSSKRFPRSLKAAFVLLFFILICLVPLGYYYKNYQNIWKQEALLKTDETERQNEKKTTKPEVKKSKRVSFTIAGDMMFDRSVDARFRGDKIFEIFSELPTDFFNQTDLSIANLEGPISSTEIEINETRDNLIFNFPPRTTEALERLKIKAVSLANNHTLNNGQAGFEHTKKVLTEKGIVPIGSQNIFDESSIGRFTYSQGSISVLAIDLLAIKTDISEKIKAEKEKGSYVITFPHWGVEYDIVHSLSQESLAKSWIDAGADAVIGSHPHVIQDAQVYKGKPIFYSLGNFLFDQTFSAETQQGLVLRGEFTDSKITIEVIPVVSKKLKPQVATDERDAIIERFDALLSKNKVLSRAGVYSF